MLGLCSRFVLSVLCLVFLAAAQDAPVTEFFERHGSSHTNNWAVLVCASRYWFNYRVRRAPAPCATPP